MVAGNSNITEDLVGLIEVIEFNAGEMIICQGASDNDMFFILSGSFSIVVNGKVVAKRGANEHVEEMSAIESGGRRRSHLQTL